MSNTTNIRRAATVAGATAFFALSMAAPASARVDPGTGSSEEQHCSVSCYSGPGVTAPESTTPRVDENGIEVLQLGAGILAGMALAGAGMTLASRRSHGHVEHLA